MKPIQITEKVLIGFALTGIIIQSCGIEKGEFFLNLAGLVLPLFYLFLYTLLFEKQNRKTMVSIITGLFFGITASGIFAKFSLIQPYGSYFLSKTGILFLGLVMVWCFYKYFKGDENKEFYKKNILRILIIVIIGFTVMITPSKQIAYLFYRHDYILYKLVIDRLNNPDEEKYYIAIDEYLKKRNSSELTPQ